MKKIALLGLLLALAVVALVTPAPNAYAANACLEACTDAYLFCDYECTVAFPPGSGQTPQLQACQTECRHQFGACRRGC